MPDIFTIVIKKLQEMGAFNFLFPFMLTTAIFYGLLRKSKLFSTEKTEYRRDEKTKNLVAEKVQVGSSVNAIIALIAGFMVWAYPILSGINIEQQLSQFFMHGIIVTLVLIVALLIAGLFLPPDLPQKLYDDYLKGSKSAIILVGAIVIGVIIFITSGLIDLIIGPIFLGIDLGNDTILSIVVIGLLIIPLIFIFREGRSPEGKGPEKSEEKKPG